MHPLPASTSPALARTGLAAPRIAARAASRRCDYRNRNHNARLPQAGD